MEEREPRTTGAGSGLTLNIAAGTASINNTWKATCSALADQSGNGQHATQATASRQPVVTIGLNGKCGLLFDGVNDYMTSSVGSLLSFPYQILVVGRRITSIPGANCFVSGDAFSGTMYEPTANNCWQYNGAQTNGPIPVTLGTAYRLAAKYTNSTSYFLQVGATLLTGGNAGAATGTNRSIGATTVPAQFGNVEIFSVIYIPVVSYAAFDAALNTAQRYGPGSITV